MDTHLAAWIGDRRRNACRKGDMLSIGNEVATMSLIVPFLLFFEVGTGLAGRAGGWQSPKPLALLLVDGGFVRLEAPHKGGPRIGRKLQKGPVCRLAVANTDMAVGQGRNLDAMPIIIAVRALPPPPFGVVGTIIPTRRPSSSAVIVHLFPFCTLH
jgi:hypothetical protein